MHYWVIVKGKAVLMVFLLSIYWSIIHIYGTMSFFMNFRSMTWLNKACWVEWINLSCMFPDFSEARVEVRDGLSVFTVPLPSRRENCEFTLKPVSQTVGDLLNYMTKEDGGIDRAAVYTDGKSKGARSTPHTLRMRGWMEGVKFIG